MRKLATTSSKLYFLRDARARESEQLGVDTDPRGKEMKSDASKTLPMARPGLSHTRWNSDWSSRTSRNHDSSYRTRWNIRCFRRCETRRHTRRCKTWWTRSVETVKRVRFRECRRLS